MAPQSVAARLVVLLVVVWMVACSKAPPPPAASQSVSAESSGAASWAADPPGTPLDAEHSIGPGHTVGRLTAFNVYAKEPKDVGEITSLERALESGTASVHEIGASRDGAAPIRSRQNEGADPQGDGNAAAQVNKIAIENRGEIPVLVLAGTIVKGGNQDRQIGEDFVVAPGRSVDVDAYCVEHGRWSASREGKPTGGHFSVANAMAVGTVRVAGQYEKDQGKVWSNVAKTNAANERDAPSGTLLASMDDEQATAKRRRIADEITSALAKDPEQSRVVGIAYAIDGEVRGVRWFAASNVYALFRGALIETAAFEAVTAESTPAPPSATAPSEAGVAAFVASMQRETNVERRDVPGQSRAMRRSEKGYASELSYDGAAKAPAGAPSSAGAPPPKAPITMNFFKK